VFFRFIVIGANPRRFDDSIKSKFNFNRPLMKNIESIHDGYQNFIEENIIDVPTAFHPLTDFGEDENRMINSVNLIQ